MGDMPAISAERVIELAIGLDDSSDLAPGTRPPYLAGKVMQRLAQEGFVVIPQEYHLRLIRLAREKTGS